MSLNFMQKDMPKSVQSVAKTSTLVESDKEEGIYLKSPGVQTIQTTIAGQVQTVPKIVPEVEPKAQLSELESMVQTYLMHKKYLDAIDNKAIMAEMETIRKTLLAMIPGDVSDKDQYTFSSPVGQITFSPTSETTSVKSATELIEHVYTQYGPEVLETIVKFGITELKKVLSAVELKKFTEQKKGSRTLKSATYA